MDSQQVAQQIWAAIGGRIQDRVTGLVRKQLDGKQLGGRFPPRLWPMVWDQLDPVMDRVLLQAKEDCR